MRKVWHTGEMEMVITRAVYHRLDHNLPRKVKPKHKQNHSIYSSKFQLKLDLLTYVSQFIYNFAAQLTNRPSCTLHMI